MSPDVNNMLWDRVKPQRCSKTCHNSKNNRPLLPCYPTNNSNFGCITTLNIILLLYVGICMCVRVHASSFCGFLCLWQMNLNATLGKLISNTTALTGTYAYITVNKCILVYIYTFIYTATILYASRLFSPSLANRLTMNLTMSSLLSHLALVRCQLHPSWTFIFRFAISLLYVACCNVAVCGTYVACFCGQLILC